MTWTRVSDFKNYIKNQAIDPEELDSPVHLARRFYHNEGSEYPLLCITIRSDWLSRVYKDKPKGIRISYTVKEKCDGWWDDHDSFIPLELTDDLVEMVNESKEKLQEFLSK